MSVELPNHVASASDSAVEALKATGVLDKLPELLRIVEELFPGHPVAHEIATDPEIPSEHYMIFHVTAANEGRDIAQRRRKWHDESFAALSEHCDKVRLSVVVEE